VENRRVQIRAGAGIASLGFLQFGEEQSACKWSELLRHSLHVNREFRTRKRTMVSRIWPPERAVALLYITPSEELSGSHTEKEIKGRLLNLRNMNG
jgi:hypothetical protein